MADVTHTKIDEMEAIDYPEHDHSPEGIGGQMFAERPQQLDQEEVYVALRGSGTLEADGERYPLDATPGEPYETGGTL